MEQYTMVNGKMTKEKVMVKKFGRMERYMLVNLQMAGNKVMVNELLTVKKSKNFMEIV